MVSYNWSNETVPLLRMVAKILHVKHLAMPSYHCECSDYHFWKGKLGDTGILGFPSMAALKPRF